LCACSIHGTCATDSGACTCQYGWWNATCAKPCNTCAANGLCDSGAKGTGECLCKTSATAPACNDHGTCNTTTGVCTCAIRHWGVLCEHNNVATQTAEDAVSLTLLALVVCSALWVDRRRQLRKKFPEGGIDIKPELTLSLKNALAMIAIATEFWAACGLGFDALVPWPKPARTVQQTFQIAIFDFRGTTFWACFYSSFAMTCVLSILGMLLWCSPNLLNSWSQTPIMQPMPFVYFVAGLFRIGMFRTLMQAFNCDYDTNVQPYLRADPDVVCWEGEHIHLVILAAIGLVLLTFVAILIFPRLYNTLQGPSLQIRWTRYAIMCMNVVDILAAVINIFAGAHVFTQQVMTALLWLAWLAIMLRQWMVGITDSSSGEKNGHTGLLVNYKLRANALPPSTADLRNSAREYSWMDQVIKTRLMVYITATWCAVCAAIAAKVNDEHTLWPFLLLLGGAAAFFFVWAGLVLGLFGADAVSRLAYGIEEGDDAIQRAQMEAAVAERLESGHRAQIELARKTAETEKAKSEAKLKAEAEKKLKAEAKERARAEAKLKAVAEAKLKAETKERAEAKLKAEAEAKLKAETKRRAKAEDEAAKAKAENAKLRAMLQSGSGGEHREEVRNPLTAGGAIHEADTRVYDNPGAPYDE